MFNDPDTPVQDLVDLIRKREQKLKEHFSYFVPPYDEGLLNMLGYMYMEMGQLQKSLAIFLLGRYYIQVCLLFSLFISRQPNSQLHFTFSWENQK